MGNTNFSVGKWAQARVSFECWRSGWPLRRLKKTSWNRRRNIGGRDGRRWNSCGRRNAVHGRVPDRCRASCIWHRRNRIAGHPGKKDFPDAERLVKRLVAQELTLSFVPDGEQRLWRTVMRRKYQLTRNRVQFQNRLECLLEEAHIKLSSLVSDLLGLSARRMLQALADGATSPDAVAALRDKRLRATPEQLSDALGACTDMHPVYRRLVKMALEELRLLEEQINQLDRSEEHTSELQS